MSAQRGREMRKYLVAISILVILLIAGVMLYSTFDSIRRIDRQMEKEEERVVLQLVSYLKDSLNEVATVGTDPELMSDIINPELMSMTDIASQLKLLQAITELQRAQFAADYMTYVSGNMVLSSSVREGLEITDFPTKMPAEGYEILGELGGREGTFISVFQDTEMSPVADEEFVNVSVNRTEDFEAMKDFYSTEKSDLVTRQVLMGIIAAIIALIISASGVHLLTRRYITAPIEELADASHRIMEGTFEGDVEVVEESDYADIQRLLQSGKILMDKMQEASGDD